MVQSPHPNPIIVSPENTVISTQPTIANNHIQQLPKHGLGRAKDILPFLPFSKTTLFEWSKDGRFVAPVKLSPTMTAWSYALVHEWINKHASTTSEV